MWTKKQAELHEKTCFCGDKVLPWFRHTISDYPLYVIRKYRRWKDVSSFPYLKLIEIVCYTK